MSLTNADIGNYARAGKTGQNYRGSFSTDAYPGGMRYPRYYGYLPDRLRKILQERAPYITQVVYSYSTPIAWLDSGVWIKPAVTYSATTSSKHQSQVTGRSIPWDAGLEEYLAVLDNRITFNRYGTRNPNIGTYTLVK